MNEYRECANVAGSCPKTEMCGQKFVIMTSEQHVHIILMTEIVLSTSNFISTDGFSAFTLLLAEFPTVSLW